uniref:Uncharacterized protein n=1 Tax=Meloidogyne enterolobii TaxID=390850 RepID=A0A6V7UR70_MELEN|nr:unnamed protein product [Meloidogyne enterolobii]
MWNLHRIMILDNYAPRNEKKEGRRKEDCARNIFGYFSFNITEPAFPITSTKFVGSFIRSLLNFKS